MMCALYRLLARLRVLRLTDTERCLLALGSADAVFAAVAARLGIGHEEARKTVYQWLGGEAP